MRRVMRKQVFGISNQVRNYKPGCTDTKMARGLDLRIMKYKNIGVVPSHDAIQNSHTIQVKGKWKDEVISNPDHDTLYNFV